MFSDYELELYVRSSRVDIIHSQNWVQVIEILWQKPCPELSKIKRECFSASEDPYSRPRRFVVVGSRPGYFNALSVELDYQGQIAHDTLTL